MRTHVGATRPFTRAASSFRAIAVVSFMAKVTMGDVLSAGVRGPRRAHVERDGADPLDDVREDQCAVRVREVAHRGQVVLEAVVHRDPRELHQRRVPVHEALVVTQVDAPVALLHDAHVGAAPPELEEVHQRPLEVLLVGDDVAAERAVEPERLDDEVLTRARVRNPGDLRGKLRGTPSDGPRTGGGSCAPSFGSAAARAPPRARVIGNSPRG